MKLKVFLSFGVMAVLTTAPLADARSIKDIPAAKESLLRLVSPQFYHSLLISPIQGEVIVRGVLTNNHLSARRIVKSDVGGTYDILALELARNLQIVDLTRADMSPFGTPVLVHLLVYRIADGTMTISFAHFEGTGSNQLRYSGAAWMAVLKNDKWLTVEPRKLGPQEKRGPRMYTLAVEPANSARSLQGNGRPPITTMEIEGASVTAYHSIKDK